MLTQSQKEIRQTRISGSEIASVLGLSSFRKPIDVWRDKCGHGTDWDETEDMRRGRLLEPAIIAWYKEETGYSVRFDGIGQRTFVCKAYDRVCATPDGVVYESTEPECKPICLVEAKSILPYQSDNWGMAGTDQIPVQYIFQSQWQMAATGVLTHVDVVAFFGDRFAAYRVDWNERLFKAALGKAMVWWDRYVETRSPPPIDGSSSYAAWIAEQFPAILPPKKEYIDATPHHELIEQYADARERCEAAEKEKARLTNELKTIIGSAYGMHTHLGKIIFTHGKQCDRIDWKAIVEAMGGAEQAVIDAHTKKGKPFRQFKATLKRED